jgi:hypothetical protein
MILRITHSLHPFYEIASYRVQNLNITDIRHIYYYPMRFDCYLIIILSINRPMNSFSF